MDSKTAIEELATRVRHLERNQTSPEAAKLMARGVLTSATRVALLLGVDELPPEIEGVRPCPDCHRQHSPLVLCKPLDQSPLLREINELEAEMNAPVVLGNRGFRSFWPRNRRRA